jgi:hypothetical protein
LYFKRLHYSRIEELPFYFRYDKLTAISAYEIGLRIAVVSLIVSLIAFCLKMMRIYLTSYEETIHKILVIDSMPVLVKGTKNDELFKTSYTKIVDMLIKDNNKEFEKGGEISITNSLSEILKAQKNKDD